MATNYGLLTAGTDVLRAGLMGINEARTAKQVNDARERQENMQQTLNGLVKNEDGTYSFTPEEQAKREQEQLFKQAQIDLNNDVRRGQLATEQAGLLAKGVQMDASGKPMLSEDYKQKNQLEIQSKKAQIAKDLADARKAQMEASNPGEDIKFKRLPKDKQLVIEESSKQKARTTAISNQMNALLKQLDDPKLSEGQKLQAAQNAAKLINSPLGADAVGTDEAKRVLQYLDPAPQIFGAKGMKIGPDIKGFTESLRLQADRLNQSNDMLQGQIDSAYGRQEKIKVPLSEEQKQGLLSSPQKPQKVKVSNGKETLMIDSSDLADAMKDGFKKVQ